MDNKLIYSKIADIKNLTIQQLEKKLGLTNGVIGKAVLRNSPIKQERIRHLLSIFPDLNEKWLETGEGEPLNNKTFYPTANYKKWKETLKIQNKNSF